LRVDEGETSPIENLSFLSPEKKHTISESDIVIISDYNKGFLDNKIISQISELSKLIIMDSKKIFDLEIIDNINFIKVNELEYQNNKEIVDNHKEKFIITLGSKGVKYNGIIYPSKKPQETIDVSGAGDTFVSAFSLKFLLSNNVIDSIEFANEVCSDVVSKKGVAIPDESFKKKL
jgi:bifunctional ADP-heptose synthase (sugar kinase/adenylyltransferase)